MAETPRSDPRPSLLALANEDTRVMTGHGPPRRNRYAEYNTMLKTARERVEQLFKEGKTETEVIAVKPLNDLDAKWAANDEAAVNFLKMVYNSFKRS
jgi:hypothetical protein